MCNDFPFLLSAISTLLPLHPCIIFKEAAPCCSGKWEALSAACRLYVLAQSEEIIKEAECWPRRASNELGVSASQELHSPRCNVLLHPLPFLPNLPCCFLLLLSVPSLTVGKGMKGSG